MHNSHVSYSLYQTPAGILKVCSVAEGICEASFVEERASNTYPQLDTKKLVLGGTEFQLKVWRAAMKIPAGTTISYQELAAQIGHPKAHRAVANALGDNKIAYFVPCHRVVRKDGKLGGYHWGMARKVALLASEKQVS